MSYLDDCLWIVVESQSTHPGFNGHFTMTIRHGFKTKEDAQSFMRDRSNMKLVKGVLKVE